MIYRESKPNLLAEAAAQAGFSPIADLVCLFKSGSALYGTSTPESDRDVAGIWVESPEEALGVTPVEHWIKESQPTKEIKEGGYTTGRVPTGLKTDFTFYTLRRWASLVMKGNPGTLAHLFAENTVKTYPGWRTWGMIAQNRDAFLSQRAVKQYLGFAQNQLKRMTGDRSRNTTRPGLIAAHGYDTKFAYHVVRLAIEGSELVSTGGLTFPNPAAGVLREVRDGLWSEEQVIRYATRHFDLIEKAVPSSPLPEQPDRARVNRVIAAAYQNHWSDKNADARAEELARLAEEARIRRDVARTVLAESVGSQRYEDDEPVSGGCPRLGGYDE